MGINVYWRDETKTSLAVVLDPQMLLSRYISSSVWPDTSCLRFIDPYGDAIFNRLQIPVLIHELEVRKSAVENSATRAHLDEVLSLLKPAEGEVHTYMWFIGD